MLKTTTSASSAALRFAEPDLLEHALDPLGVVGVHLAAEGGDEVPAHRRRVAAPCRGGPARDTGDVSDLPAPDARPTALSSTLVLTAVLAATLAAWAVAVEQMRGMDAGPGTDLGSFAWFVGIWLTMTIAMMLPSAAPTTLDVLAPRPCLADHTVRLGLPARLDGVRRRSRTSSVASLATQLPPSSPGTEEARGSPGLRWPQRASTS